MNSKNGISLIVLVITIAVLIILSSAIIYVSSDTANNAKLGAFASDLNQIDEVVTEYYLTNNELPITTDTYTKTTLVSSIEDGATYLSSEITANGDDDATFYKIDMSKLDINSTSRGIEQDGDITDVFVIAEDSLNVYYLKGQKVANKYYFSLTEELTSKTKVEKNDAVDTSTTSISGSTDAIVLKKNTTEWTNELTVKVDTELATGETLKYYIAGQDVTANVTDNTIDVSEILLADDALKTNFYASESNKIVTVEKYSNETVVAKKTIKIANLDILVGDTISASNISYTEYDEFKIAKITGYSDLGGSGLKEIRVLYTSKLDSDGNTVAYYNSLPSSITKEYVYSSGIKSTSTTFKLPIDVTAYAIVFVDNAGNISDVYSITGI